MKINPFYLSLFISVWALVAQAYPPAPHYQIFGSVRDEQGNPLTTSEGVVIMRGYYSAHGVAQVSGGSVTGVTLLSGGAGHTAVPTVSIIDASGNGSGATGTAVLTDGVVTGVTITNGGSGYSSNVNVGLHGGGVEAPEVARSITETGLAPGVNYSLSVPMDSGTSAQLYDVSAMRPLLPFTIKVVIDGVNYVPMQIAAATSAHWTTFINGQNSPSVSTAGEHWAVGLPAGKLRLDLWLGADQNGDGLPDSWQWDVVNSDSSGRLTDYTQVDPNADFSGNGMSNLSKFLTGVYALEARDGLHFTIDSVSEDVAKLHFQAITGRTYHISSSTDLVTWTKPQPFSLESDGLNTQSYYLADSSKFVDIYVLQPTSQQTFYKLYAE